MSSTATRRAPTTPIWHFDAKIAPKAQSYSHHQSHRPPTFISTIPVMVPPPGFSHHRRLWPPYQPITITGNVWAPLFSPTLGTFTGYVHTWLDISLIGPQSRSACPNRLPVYQQRSLPKAHTSSSSFSKYDHYIDVEDDLLSNTHYPWCVRDIRVLVLV